MADKKNTSHLDSNSPDWEKYFKLLQENQDKENKRLEKTLENKFNDLSNKIDVINNSNNSKLEEIDKAFRGNGKIGVFEQLRNIRMYIKILFILVMLLYGFKVWGLGIDEIFKGFFHSSPKEVIVDKSKEITINEIPQTQKVNSSTRPATSQPRFNP